MSPRLLLALACLCGSNAAFARKPAPPAQDIQIGPNSVGTAELATLDRRATTQVKDALERLTEGDFDTALPVLLGWLNRPDRFVTLPTKTGGKSKTIPLHRAIEEAFADLTPEGRRAYSALVDRAASNRLGEARTNADRAVLAEVVRKYGLSGAGLDARYQLGILAQDTDRLTTAARHFRAVSQSSNAVRFEPYLSLRTACVLSRLGRESDAEAALDAIAGADAPPLPLGGEVRRVPDTSRLTWLESLFGADDGIHFATPDDWRLHRGSESRSTHIPPTPPSPEPAWSVALLVDPFARPGEGEQTDNTTKLRNMAAELLESLDERPSLFPLVAGDQVLVRTAGRIRAVSLTTGEHDWQTARETTLETLLRPELNVSNRDARLKQLLRQRLFADRTHGVMSTDGERLYAIEELGFSGRGIPGPQGDPLHLLPPRVNTLAAYHVTDRSRAGQRAWTVGGMENDPLFELPLSGHFFLSAPLPVSGILYVLGERAGTVKLLALAGDSGEELWSLPLVQMPTEIDNGVMRLRRQVAYSLTDAGGLLVCRCGTDHAIAVDSELRRIAWHLSDGTGRSSDTGDDARRPAPPFIPAPGPGPGPPVPTGSQVLPADPTPIVSNGVALLPRSRIGGGLVSISAVDLVTGELLWTRGITPSISEPIRVGGLLSGADEIAAVTGGNIVVLASKSFQVYDLWSGEEQLPKAKPIPERLGTGVVRDSVLYLPAAEKRLVPIDLKTLDVGEAIPSGSPVELGNLIATRGRFLSQSATHLAVFPAPPLRD